MLREYLEDPIVRARQGPEWVCVGRVQYVLGYSPDAAEVLMDAASQCLRFDNFPYVNLSKYRALERGR